MNKDMILRYFEQLDLIMNANRDYLIELDSVVGDGDLGLTMGDGFKEANRFVASTDTQDIGKLIYGAGKAMSVKVPSTMGTLMASGFMQVGKVFKGYENFEPSQWTLFFESFFDGVANRGKAKIGEKTFLDGLYPAIQVLKEAEPITSDNLVIVANTAYQAAKDGYENTSTMVALHGRAATRGEASRRLKDPGAYVAALMMQALTKSI